MSFLYSGITYLSNFALCHFVIYINIRKEKEETFYAPSTLYGSVEVPEPVIVILAFKFMTGRTPN